MAQQALLSARGGEGMGEGQEGADVDSPQLASGPVSTHGRRQGEDSSRARGTGVVIFGIEAVIIGR